MLTLPRCAQASAAIRRTAEEEIRSTSPPWQLQFARGHGHGGPGWCPSPWFDSRTGLRGRAARAERFDACFRSPRPRLETHRFFAACCFFAGVRVPIGTARAQQGRMVPR